MEAINSEIPAHKQAKVLAAVHSSRRGRVGGTVLEWLKVPAGKHSPTSITEVTDKISYLKELGVDTWSLSSISNARLRAYAQAIANRPPAESRRRVEETQALETICFLRVTLLELTDTLMYMTGRRVNDLVRHASNRVTVKQARSAVEYRQQAEAMRQIVHDDDRSAEARIAALKELLPKDEKSQPNSHAALVRQSLADDATRVTALLNSFSDLDLKGNADQRPMKQVVALRELIEQGARELPVGFDADIAGPVWHDLLNDADRTKAFAALKASTMLAVRQGLRGGRLWIDHSWEFRNREDLLIPPAEWKKERQRLISALSLTTDPQKFLARLHAHLDVGLRALSEAVTDGKLEIDADGMVRFHKLEALPVDAAIQRSRDAMFSIIGPVQFGDMIVEMDACTGFSKILLGRRAKSTQELVACYAALLAHGTENDAKGVAAMIPGIEVAHISAAMRSLEARDRLRKANERVVEFQRKNPIAELWGTGDKASADMMALDASRHLYNARVDPRRRTFAVGLYTHVLESYGVIYDQPIVHNERQSSAALEGVEQYNARSEESMRLSVLAVDTHGYTYVGMTVAKLLGFDLCPQLRDMAERRLYLPRSITLPENLERIAVTNVSEPAIGKGWDELLRLIASIRGGRVSPRAAMEKLGSAAQGDLRGGGRGHGLAQEVKPYLRGERQVEANGQSVSLSAAILIPRDLDQQIVRPGKSSVTDGSSSGVEYWSVNLADTKLRDDVEQTVNTEIRRREYQLRGMDAAAIREVDAQIEGLGNESAAVARLLADYEEQLVRIDVASAKAKRQLAEHEATLDAFDEATAAAVKRTTAAVKGIGEQVGNLGVPGAGMVASQVSEVLGTGLAAILGGGSVGTLVAVRARRKARAIEDERDEAVEQRDGARRVIAVTERFGIENIATDPNVRKQAKAALAGDDVARREFALAKAEA